MSTGCGESAPMEKMTTLELSMWLKSKGFGTAVQTAFEGVCSYSSLQLVHLFPIRMI